MVSKAVNRFGWFCHSNRVTCTRLEIRIYQQGWYRKLNLEESKGRRKIIWMEYNLPIFIQFLWVASSPCKKVNSQTNCATHIIVRNHVALLSLPMNVPRLFRENAWRLLTLQIPFSYFVAAPWAYNPALHYLILHGPFLYHGNFWKRYLTCSTTIRETYHIQFPHTSYEFWLIQLVKE